MLEGSSSLSQVSSQNQLHLSWVSISLLHGYCLDPGEKSKEKSWENAFCCKSSKSKSPSSHQLCRVSFMSCFWCSHGQNHPHHPSTLPEQRGKGTWGQQGQAVPQVNFWNLCGKLQAALSSCTQFRTVCLPCQHGPATPQAGTEGHFWGKNQQKGCHNWSDAAAGVTWTWPFLGQPQATALPLPRGCRGGRFVTHPSPCCRRVVVVVGSPSLQNTHQSFRPQVLNKPAASVLISVKPGVKKAPDLPETLAAHIDRHVKLLFVFQSFISIKAIDVTVLFS